MQGSTIEVGALAQVLPHIPQWQLLGVHPAVTGETHEQAHWQQRASFNASTSTVRKAVSEAQNKASSDHSEGTKCTAPVLQHAHVQPSSSSAASTAAASAAAAQQLADLSLSATPEARAQAVAQPAQQLHPPAAAASKGHGIVGEESFEDDLDALLSGGGVAHKQAAAVQSQQSSGLQAQQQKLSGQGNTDTGHEREQAQTQQQQGLQQAAPASARDNLEDWLDL